MMNIALLLSLRALSLVILRGEKYFKKIVDKKKLFDVSLKALSIHKYMFLIKEL